MAMKVTKIVSHSSDGEMLSLYVEIAAISDTVVEHKEKEVDGGVLFYDKYSNGVYQYGLRSTRPYMDHEAGYIWSSRASVLNQEFGTNLIDVSLKTPDEHWYWCGAVEVNKVEMPKGFSIVEKQFYNGEKYYTAIRDIPFSEEEKNYTLCGKTLYNCSDDIAPTDTVFNKIVCNQ